MTDSMKFGPEWLRNMKSDSSVLSGGVVTAPIIAATIKMAEFRYGREEMLALFNHNVLPPDPLKQIQGLFVDKIQYPLALVQMTDEETRMWNRGINSDASLRMTKPGPGVGIPGGRGALGGRGGSVDRGRGRARGSYHYSRGLSYEESDQPNGYNRGMRNFDRTQSQNNWGERNGGDPGDYNLSTSPRKEFSARGFTDTNWRRHRNGDDDDGWRGSRSDKWGRGNSWREGDNWDRPKPWEEGNNNSHPPPRKPWDHDENNLPEWAMENPSESGGSFDASGAFHGGTVYSDDEEGTVNTNNRRTEFTKSNSSQPRPSPHSKKEPPNITNGSSPQSENDSLSENQRLSSSGNSGPLRQSQSATNLPSERRPTNHPIISSASFSGVNSHTSHSTNERKLQKEVPTTKPVTTSHQSPTNNVQPSRPPEATTHSEALETKPSVKTTQEEDIEQRLLDAADVFVSRLMDEEEKEEPSVTNKTAPPPSSAPSHPPHAHTDTLWFYQDPQGNVQGPFQSSEMTEWYDSRYFNSSLLVRRAFDEVFSPLSEFIKINKESPFTMNYYLVPPIKNPDVAVTMPPLPIIDDPLLHQIHLQQQQERLLLQRQFAQAKVSPVDFANMSLDQRQLLHQAQLEMSLKANLMQQQNHNPPNSVQAMFNHHLKNQLQHQQQQQQPMLQQMGLQAPRSSTTPQNTPEEQLTIEQFMNAFRQKQAPTNVLPTHPPPQQPVTMESVWGGATAVPAFPSWSTAQLGHPIQQPQTLWSEPVTKGIKTEQQILEEQFRAEERKKEEIRKQEELQRLKDEEERLRMLEEEELERKRQEEEAEKRRLREEEEKRKREAAAAKKAEQERLKKEAERKKKEEEKKRKDEEKRKNEEEMKKAEEEKKKLEEDRKKREEIAKRQNEALKRLQEQQQQARVVKATPAPWTAPDTAGASLADIQKTERKQQQQLREQKEMLKAYQEKHQQEQQLKTSKSSSSLNLKWAEGTKIQPTRVKSLAEIQAEEQERMLKQAEKDKAERMAAAKEIPVAATGSIWASANQTLSWTNNQSAPSVWGNMPVTNSVGGSVARFFDEVNTKPKPTKPTQVTASKSQTKTKAKKEEDLVMRLFENKLPNASKSDEFNKWCHKTLSQFPNNFDIPTFRDFLLSLDSPAAVEDYVQEYLGDSKEARDFAANFIRKTRSVHRPQSNHLSETLTNPSIQSNNNFQEVKAKNKKVKKSKMTKVDSRILGFNVTAAPDRLNVGDRDYGEGS